MRKDMAKKLVETHRSSAPITYKDTRARGNDARGFENAPKREKIKGRYGYELKEFGENFPPLIGFLRKNVGRKWDDVYSELCASLKGGGALIAHTKLHLFRDFLIEKPCWIDGKPYYSPGRSYRKCYPLDSGQIYVARNGILSMVPHKPKDKRVSFWNVEDRVIVDKNKQYRKIEGSWFEILIKRLPRSPLETGQIYYDVFLKRSIGGQEYTQPNFFGIIPKPSWVWYLPSEKKLPDCQRQLGLEYPEAGYERYNYAYSKRQLNSKQIAKAGLNKL